MDSVITMAKIKCGKGALLMAILTVVAFISILASTTAMLTSVYQSITPNVTWLGEYISFAEVDDFGDDEEEDEECAIRTKSLPIIDRRVDLADILNDEGLTVGLEVGVKEGEFSAELLGRWTKCKTYILMDPWKHQEHYKDGANVAQSLQDRRFSATQQRLSKFKSKGVELQFIRDFSTNGHRQIANNSLDFVYIDARHDYQAMSEDLMLFWPKLKVGGIFAGHDFLNANEEAKPQEGRDWCTFADGTRCVDNKAVKAAVEEFASAHDDRQILVPRRETRWVTWYMRK